jgi:sporulation protein YlmC with PRC-barrel domain
VTGRTRDLCLHLLDRQVVDVDGQSLGKVDDVEIEEGCITALLLGPGALGCRLGVLGRWIAFWAGDPVRIGMDQVTDLGTVITVTSQPPPRGEQALRRHVIEKVPGARG